MVSACHRANSTAESALHLIGMISDEGVHSDIRHLFALLELAKLQKVKGFIHAITDGRDVPERSAAGFIKGIQAKIESLEMEKEAKIATIIGDITRWIEIQIGIAPKSVRSLYFGKRR